MRGCPRMHMHALTKSGNASAGGDDFLPREFERAWAPIECLPFFFHLFCFVAFTRSIVVSSCRWCERYRQHVLVFTAVSIIGSKIFF